MRALYLLVIGVVVASLVQSAAPLLAKSGTNGTHNSTSIKSGVTQIITYDCTQPRDLVFTYQMTPQFGASSGGSRDSALNFLYVSANCASCNNTDQPIELSVDTSPSSSSNLSHIVSSYDPKSNSSLLGDPFVYPFTSPQSVVLLVTVTPSCQDPTAVYEFQLTVIWQDHAQYWVVFLLTFTALFVVSLVLGLSALHSLKRSCTLFGTNGYVPIQDPISE